MEKKYQPKTLNCGAWRCKELGCFGYCLPHDINCYCKECIPSREQEIDGNGNYVNLEWIKNR